MNKKLIKKIVFIAIAVVVVAVVTLIVVKVIQNNNNKDKFDNESDALVFSTLEVDKVFNPFFSTSATDSTVVGMTQIGMLGNDKDGKVVYGDNEAVVTKDLQIVTKGEKEEAITKGGDSMALPINIPDEYLDDPEMIEAIRLWTAEYNKPFEDKVVFGKPYSAEAQKNQVVKKANSVLVNLMKQIDARRSTNLTYETIKAANGITGAFGEITLNNKKYAFKYDATFEYPTVFGAMSMDIIAQAKAVLDKTINFDRDETQLGQKHKNETIYDFDNNIVVWVADDGCFKGYTDKHAFVWDPSHAMPIGTPVASALKNKWKKMNASWGKNFPALAAFIMDYCRQINNNTNDEIDLEDTNEIIIETHKNASVVNTTVVENTEDIVTAWDDIDI